MRPTSFHVESLLALLRRRKVVTLPELKHALGTQTTSTVFRKLASLAYRTSYSHRGAYYTLDETARFDADGLWSFRQVWFSRHGTLLDTVEAMVGASLAGYHADELEGVLHVAVKAPLVKLVRQARLDRQQVAGRWLYLSAEPAVRRRQLSARQVHQAAPSSLGLGGGVRALPDELKAAIVLFYSLLDEQQRRLCAGLEALKIGHGGDTQIAELLGIDPATVAAGRCQLLSGEILTGRARRGGGGRKPAEKKPPSSSPTSSS